MKLALSTFLLVALAAPAMAAPPPLPYKLPPDPPAMTTAYQDGQISRGEIVVNYKSKHPIYWLDVYGLIDAPADQVWKAITSYGRYQDFLPRVVESGVDEQVAGVGGVQQSAGRLPCAELGAPGQVVVGRCVRLQTQHGCAPTSYRQADV